jgi:glycosyltransferase involved in cell wall biosynthesis
MRPEDVQRFRLSAAFDQDWYTAAYPDVLASGIDPAEHFLWLGAKLGRSPLPPTAAEEGRAEKRSTIRPGRSPLDAVFIDGTNGTSSTVYRVDRIAGGLARNGWRVATFDGEDVPDLVQGEQLIARYTIIHRAQHRGAMPAFVDNMRSHGSTIVYDVDDLIFDPDVLPFVDAYRHMDEATQAAFASSLYAYRDFVLNADVCTSSTQFLVDRIRQLGKPAYRIRNSLSSQDIDLFRSVSYRQRQRPLPFMIGYYSGTKTHHADFAAVAPALAKFMREEKDVVFRLVGAFDLSAYPELARWQKPAFEGGPPRVITVGLMPHKAMIRDQLNCDLIIAPLETGNPFCEAKSELKFFEAALTKCPVVASPTSTFVEATDGGRFALLASTSDDWYEAFRSIHEAYGKAIERAENAFDHICSSYSQEFAASEAMAAYEDFTIGRARRCGKVRRRSRAYLPVQQDQGVGARA